ncbi:CvpA family protein [Sulfurimonas sp. SAG-AH-194-C20]|nr:CvpA family protein [Sulfurimonas sp. SAG-AH-194-C20]MDF1878976.1 CvpA family protein [Sulfurimonas sp. SAG-AH-194-C20]
MEINYFDIVAAVIILLLGLKGIINGFFKELFGLVGIVGGLFIASRFGDLVGEYLNSLVFNFSSPSAVSFLGFLTTLSLFWLFMILIGYAFKKLSSMSGLGPVDRILGFVFGASKFFLIAAVIAHAAYNIKAVKSTLDSIMKTSILFPIMVDAGAFIMKIDPVGLSKDINTTIMSGTQVIKEKTDALINKSTKEEIQKIQDQLKQQIQNQTKEK